MKGRMAWMVLLLLLAVAGRADEGMWMLGNLNRQTRKAMKERGLELPADRLYSTRRPR